jgi:pimeloyl-ACP methyl ester carboxylesterase
VAWQRRQPTTTTAIDAPFPVAGAELHVAAPQGDGAPLVLIHGAWTDHATWNLAVPHLEAFRVIRDDRRGHSRSTRGDRPAWPSSGPAAGRS